MSALSRLFFILAVATLYVTAQGVWQWVKTVLMEGWQLIGSVYFKSNHDPEPVITSRKQARQKRQQLELKVQTYCYRTD